MNNKLLRLLIDEYLFRDDKLLLLLVDGHLLWGGGLLFYLTDRHFDLSFNLVDFRRLYLWIRGEMQVREFLFRKRAKIDHSRPLYVRINLGLDLHGRLLLLHFLVDTPAAENFLEVGRFTPVIPIAVFLVLGHAPLA